MPIYVYIDESGDLGFHPEKSSTHLIVTALFVSDPLKLDRIIKNIRRNSFKKGVKNCLEIKGSKLNESLVKRLLIELNEIHDIKIIHIIAEKQSIQKLLFENNKHEFYNTIVGEIAKHIPFEKTELEIRIDKSKNKKDLRDEFNSYFIEIFNSHSSCKITESTIHHSDSKLWSGLQFADVLAWSEYQKIAFNKNEFISIIDESKQKEYIIKKEVFQKNNPKKKKYTVP